LRLAGVLCVVVVGSLFGMVGVAFAGSPWWHVISVSRPTDLHAGAARDEVQELAVDPETDFTLSVRTPAAEGGMETVAGVFATEPLAASEGLPQPTAANIQTALEGVYGAGNVVVTGGPGGSAPLLVHSVGVNELVVSVGAHGTASTRVVTEGASDGSIVVIASDVGDAEVNGAKSPVVISDVVPPGLKAVGIYGRKPHGASQTLFEPLECSSVTLSCSYSGTLPPFDEIEVRIPVVVEPGARTGEENVVSLSGGEAPSVSVAHPVVINSAPAPFGVEDYELDNEEVGGALDAQAGSHPFQQTSTIALNTATATYNSAQSSALAKDLSFKWPAGLIGDPTPFPQCTLAQFFTKACPAASVLGVATSVIDEPGVIGVTNVIVPLVNLEPAFGEPARLAFLPDGTPVSVGASVRTGEDYGITVNVQNITQIITFLSSEVTVWGVPGSPAHDAMRTEGCQREERGYTPQEVINERLTPCEPLDENDPPPFLTLPTACTGPLETTVQGDSWIEPKPAGEEPVLATFKMPALDGCNRLAFSPSIKVTPDGTAGSTATGLTVDEHVPQQSTLDANGLAEAAVKGLSVTLPAGVQVNPSSGDGLLACSQEQIALASAAITGCPEAAKVATVKVKVPVLAAPLEGAAYIAAQNENPFGSLMAMYIYAENPAEGVRVKAAGQVFENPENGQLTARFERDPAFNGKPLSFQFLPDAPVEDVELHFFGGERAPLATPAHCGAYTTTASFVPWSAEPSDEAALTAGSSSTFDITSGPHGSSCPGASLPFAPSLTGGVTNINAGAFSPLTTTISRGDGEQNLASVQLHMPPGVEGLLSSVKLCPETQANEGTCGPESQIGETTVSAGVGNEPVAVKGGRVYITEKYEGAPFGLSIVNPVKAGPFDLEHDTSNPNNDPACDCLVVRARIEINPESGELTVTTNQAGPHAIPHIIDGIPVQIKKVNVLVNREHFAFNPTSCNPLAMTGTIAGVEGASQPVSVPFQVTNCTRLNFNPKITVNDTAHASKAEGEGLVFKISYPKGAMGSQSWLNEAKFDIPKQLPARLGTLQQACLANTFEHNRPACPKASIIGHAIVHTQVIPVPLEGPVYFVSYGNAKFPDAVIVLKGYGITIEQHGETFIKNGITSATFRNIPDVPFENLQVTIPTGPYSEFGANLPNNSYNFCNRKLTLPTLFKASNGQEIHQTTPITTTNCPTPHKHGTKKHATKKHKK
jgi:hypothetical protein